MTTLSSKDLLSWIRCHRISGGGIVVSTKKMKSYPEVTGYLIPSLLRHGETMLAGEFARWLISIQQADGSFTDPDGTGAFAFDTGQVVRGLVAVAPHLPEAGDALIKACRFLVSNSTIDGRLPVPSGDAWSMGKRGRIPESVHLYVLPAIQMAGDLLDDRRLRGFVARSLDWYLRHSEVEGFTKPNMLSHLFCYVQEALVDLGAEDVARRAMAELENFQMPSGAVPAYSDVAWVCTPGQFQASIVWRKLGDAARADAALAFGESLVNGSGGFFGSYGVGADYFPAEEISWASKFHVDAIDLRNDPPPARVAVQPPRTAPKVPAAPPSKAAERTAAPTNVGLSQLTVPSSKSVAAPVATQKNLDPSAWHKSIHSGVTSPALAEKIRRGEAPHWLKPILDATKPDQKLLELGSGTGELSAHLAKAKRHVTLLDFSRDSLDAAAQLFMDCDLVGTTIEADVTQPLPFSDGEFDCVWSSGLLEHFDDEVIIGILADSARCSRGKVVALVPNAASLAYRIGKFVQERDGKWQWGREDPKASLRRHFVQAGLTNVRETTIDPLHAVEFLKGIGDGSIERSFRAFIESLPAEEVSALGQGYLLVTVGEVLPRTLPPTPPKQRTDIVARAAPARGEKRRLAVVPHDPVQAYVDAGYPDLTEYFNPCGFFDEVYCLSPHEPKEREIWGMKVIPTSVDAFATRVQELGIDVVRAYDMASGLIACRRKVSGVPVVVSVHNVQSDVPVASIPEADLWLSISGAVTSHLESLGVARDRIRKFSNRVDLDVFKPRVDGRRKAEFDRLFPAKYRVLHVGRRTRQKNLETVIRALGILGKDYCGIFIGKGDVQPYRVLAKAHGVVERCHFIDSVKNEELPYWYSFAECMCTPSRFEGFGIVFIEAMACGSVVVTSDKAPMNEFIGDGLSGILVKDYEDPDALAEAIERACTDTKVRDFVRANARFGVERFSKAAVDRREADIYRETLGLPPTPVAQDPAVATSTSRQFATVPLGMDTKSEWDRIVASSRDAWFFHDFAEQVLLEQAWNGQTLSFLIELEGKIVGAFPIQRWRWDPDVIHSTLMGTGGPIVVDSLSDTARRAVLEFAHGAVQEIVRMGHAKEVRIALPPLSGESRAHWATSRNPLLDFGYEDASTRTQVIDLDASLDTILHGFSKGHRSALHKAEKQGLEIRPAASLSDIDEYYALHVETYRRTGERPHPRAYFDAIWKHFGATGKARILIARLNGRAVAATNIAHFGEGTLYWTGAYSVEGLASEAGKLLQWEAIKWAKSVGARWHEVGEVFPDADAGSKLEGLTTYKRGFGGTARPFFRGRFVAP